MKKKKNSFREWLSDNLRYLMLIAAFALGVFAIVLGVRMFNAYQNMQSARAEQTADQIIVIEDASETAKVTETAKASETTAQTETEANADKGAGAQKETDLKSEGQSETQTESGQTVTEKGQTSVQAQSETKTASETTLQSETKSPSETSAQAQTSVQAQTNAQSQTNAQTETQQQSETQRQTETQPETQKETEEIDTLQRYASSQTRYSSTEANVRSGPGTGYVSIGTASGGEELTITGETTGWYQVDYNGKKGYIAKGLTVEEYTPDYRTITGTCYLRSEADYGENIICEIGAGTVVEYLGGDGWIRVRLDDGTVGYVGAGFIG